MAKSKAVAIPGWGALIKIPSIVHLEKVERILVDKLNLLGCPKK